MNRIDRIRTALTKEAGPDAAYGFNSALALDLPLKFAEWKDEECFFNLRGWCLHDLLESGSPEFTNEELYDYWIQNVYGNEK